MARINEGCTRFICHPHVYPQVEWAILAFTSQPQSVATLWLVLIFRPAEGRRLSWLGGLMKCWWFAARSRRRSPIPVFVVTAAKWTRDHQIT